MHHAAITIQSAHSNHNKFMCATPFKIVNKQLTVNTVSCKYALCLLKNRWSDQQLITAKTAVTSKRMSRRAAAKEFGIPLTTL